MKLSPPDLPMQDPKRNHHSPKPSVDSNVTKSPTTVKQLPRLLDTNSITLHRSSSSNSNNNNKNKSTSSNIREKNPSHVSPSHSSNMSTSSTNKTKAKAIPAPSPNHTKPSTHLKEHRRSYSNQTEQSNPDTRPTTKLANNASNNLSARKDLKSPRVVPEDRIKESRTSIEDILPPCLTPLPDAIYRAVDEYEKKLAIRESRLESADESDEDALLKKTNARKAAKMTTAEDRLVKKRDSINTSSTGDSSKIVENGSHKPSEVTSSKRSTEVTASKTNSSSSKISYIAQKGPSKRPPQMANEGYSTKDKSR